MPRKQPAKRKVATRAKFASAIPTSRQLQKARSEGWASWIRTPQDEAAVAQGCWFDLERAEAVRTYFCERFSHGKDRFYNLPFVIAADNWLYRDVLGPIYGWRTLDGFRRCRSVYVEVPKKNGKTQVAAGISLVEMRYVHGARVYIVATSRGQANECFDEAAGMVERRSWLKRFYKVLRSTGKILYPQRNSAIEVLPKNAAGSEGKNASALILDELHAWTDRALFDSLLFAGAARANPLLFMITTAGKDLSSLCYSEHERAERQAKGLDLSIDHHSVIYAADRHAKWDDIAQWKKANPNFGVTMTERSIKLDIESARGRPSRIAALKRYRLNIWTNESDTWLDQHKWESLEKITAEELAGEAYGGLDMARINDFAAFVLLLRDPKGWQLFPRLYVPAEKVIEKEEIDKIPLSVWVDKGWVIATPGSEIDADIIRRDIVAAHKRFSLIDLGYDPYMAGQLAKALRAEDGIECTAVPQTMPFMAVPSTELERAISGGTIRHNHNPALTWMVGNAVAIQDNNGNVRPTKKRSRGRIDGVVAAVIAMQRALSPDHAEQVSDEPAFWL